LEGHRVVEVDFIRSARFACHETYESESFPFFPFFGEEEEGWELERGVEEALKSI
jgi:hypothetical protein